MIHPNPFISPPERVPAIGRALGTLRVCNAAIPTLVELCMQAVASSSWSDCVDYENVLPKGLESRNELLDAIADAVIADDTAAIYNLLGSTCHNPMHKRQGRHISNRQQVVERLEWQETIANIQVKPRAPICWRGCSIACLNFLDDSQSPDSPGIGEIFHSGLGADGQEVDLSSDDDE